MLDLFPCTENQLNTYPTHQSDAIVPDVLAETYQRTILLIPRALYAECTLCTPRVSVYRVQGTNRNDALKRVIFHCTLQTVERK